MSLWEVLLSIFFFMMLVAWIWLLIAIIGDVFRDHELSGWGKALWTLFIVVTPWLGTLIYLIARGRSMNERALERARTYDQEYRRSARDAAADTPSVADELSQLAGLRDHGRITPEEFDQAKARILGMQTSDTSSTHVRVG